MDPRFLQVDRFVAATHPVRQLHRVVCLSVSHRTVPGTVLERFVFSEAERERFYARMLGIRDQLQAAGQIGTAEVALLSTCNRTEIYLTATEPPALTHGTPDAHFDASGEALASGRFADAALATLAQIKQLAPDELASVHALHGPAAIQHLLEVATSLQSAVLGETQILQQLKDAYAAAHHATTAGEVLYGFFHIAFRAGRRVHAETAIAEGNVSTASVGVELARRRLGGSLEGKHALLIGAGKIGRLTIKQLLDRGVRRILLANRTLERLAPMRAEAERHGAAVEVAPLDQIERRFGEVDLIVTALAVDSGPRFVREHFVGRAAGSGGGSGDSSEVRRVVRRVVLDLGLPPNVCRSVGDLPHLERIGLEDLADGSAAAIEGRGAEIPAVRAIIREEWSAFEDTQGAAKKGVVDALFRHFSDVAAEQARKQVGRGLPRDEADLAAYNQRLVRQLLGPIAQRFAKLSDADPDHLDHLKSLVDLFGLHPDDV